MTTVTGGPKVAPYGTWASPITASRLVEQSVRLSDLVVDGDRLYWVEGRPTEGGRQVVVEHVDDVSRDVLPEGFSARTLVHEYGGAPMTAHDGVVYFVNFADQRIYAVSESSAPRPVTPEPPEPAAWRYAAPVVTPDGAWLICVRERHDEVVVHDLVAWPTGEASDKAPVVLAAGHDFTGTPALSPDGRRVAYCTWDHPLMPWDGTELWELALETLLPTSRAGIGGGEVPADSQLVANGAARRIAGGPDESVTQPRYAPDGVLHFVSDRSGWWNLYADDDPGGHGRALAPLDAELAGPDWVFGLSSYDFLTDGTLVATWSADGRTHIGRLDASPENPAAPESPESPEDPEAPETTSRLIPISVSTRFGSYEQLRALRRTPGASGGGTHLHTHGDTTGGQGSDYLFAIAGSSSLAAAVVRIDLATGAVEVIRSSRKSVVAPSYLSEPRAVTYATEGGLDAHALYYPPANADFVGPPSELPPLIVAIHGGPTSHASATLNYSIQYWTSRGFAVADVDYGGSSGYGRAYRKRLEGSWGIVDVADCVNAATALAALGEVDASRLIIHGGSAGGFTTLRAISSSDVFAGAASYYGVADLSALARETHAFESRYLDGLVGPWPEAEQIYEDRSPLSHVDEIRTPLIVFQGLEDKVVPPDQSERIVEALRTRGVPVAYVSYPGEQHGFRRAENIVRTAEAELYFYGQVLGFTPADDLAPVEIANSQSLPAR